MDRAWRGRGGGGNTVGGLVEGSDRTEGGMRWVGTVGIGEVFESGWREVEVAGGGGWRYEGRAG